MHRTGSRSQASQQRDLHIHLSLLLLVLAILGALSAPKVHAQTPPLKRMFYNATCPSAETIVKEEVTSWSAQNPSIAAKLLRLFFHDCFVRGCDASILLDGTVKNPAEKASRSNTGVAGFDLINRIKTRLEQQCPATVSCADITVLATRDALVLAGGPFVPMDLGRRDGLVSMSVDATVALPTSMTNATQLLTSFRNVGLNSTDLVALSGAHTLGVARCAQIRRRLPPNNDTSWDPSFARSLAAHCGNNTETAVNLDAVSPARFDNQYYKNLLLQKGLLFSDSTLATNYYTQGLVQAFAGDEKLFVAQFISSMQKLSRLRVLTGTRGEVRRDCRHINPKAPPQPSPPPPPPPKPAPSSPTRPPPAGK